MNGLRDRLVLGLLGTFVCLAVGGGQYLRYVRPGMKPVLIVTGAVLIFLAVEGALREWRDHDRVGRAGHDDHASGHRHDDGASGSAWLMLAPVVCLTLLAPPSLGSFSASRAADASASSVQDVGWTPLPDGAVVPLTFGDFVTRARWDRSRTLAGRTVRLTGFVIPAQGDRPGDGWTLGRMSIMCCAADAAVYRVRIVDAEPATGRFVAPAADSWIEVEGEWVPEPAGVAATAAATPEPPRLRLLRMRPVEAPAEPYE